MLHVEPLGLEYSFLFSFFFFFFCSHPFLIQTFKHPSVPKSVLSIYAIYVMMLWALISVSSFYFFSLLVSLFGYLTHFITIKCSRIIFMIFVRWFFCYLLVLTYTTNHPLAHTLGAYGMQVKQTKNHEKPQLLPPKTKTIKRRKC